MSAILFLAFLFTLIGGIGLGIYRALSTKESSNGYSSKTTFNLGTAVKFGLLGFVLSLVPLTLFAGYAPVEQGTVGVVKRMGAVTGTLQPGPHFVTPFITSVSEVSTKTLSVNPSEDASSQDLQQVHTQVTLTYHFNSDNDSIIYIYSKLIDNSPNAVENKVVNPAIYEAIKASEAKYTVQELVQKRAQVRDDIENMVKARLIPYHITAETTSITDFRFSDAFEKSIESKQVAQQDAEKASNILNQKKIEAEQVEAEAKGQAAANVAAAEGEAKAIIAKADAQAKANRELAASLTQQLILNKAIDKWNGQRPMVEGGKGSGLLLQLPAMSNTPSKDDDQ